MNKISVIIAIKDYCHKKLLNCVDKIINQDYQNWEIIIKHNGIKEELIRLESDLQNEKIKIISLPDKSLGEACNQAIKYTTGDIISIFHHDDLFRDKAFSTIIKNIDDSMWYFGKINYHVNEQIVPTYYKENVLLCDMKKQNYIPQPACFFKKEIYSEIGEFNDKMKLCWDYDYWVRIMKKYKPKFIPFTFADYFLNPNSITLKFPQSLMDAEKSQIQYTIE